MAPNIQYCMFYQHTLLTALLTTPHPSLTAPATLPPHHTQMPGVLRLEEEAPGLRDLALCDIEVPGVYCALLGGGDPPPWVAPQPAPPPESNGQVPPQPHTDGPVLLEAIGATVAIVRRQGAAYRRLAFHGSDGRTRHMIIQQHQNWQQASVEERLLQLQRAFNRLLDAHPQSRARALHWYTPAVVPVYPSTRLVEEEPSAASYGEAYDVNCMRYGREADSAIVYFKKRCAHSQTGALTGNDAAIRQAAFAEVCEKIVSENVFSQYIYKTLPSCNHLWVFKKTFCTQMSLSGKWAPVSGEVLGWGGRGGGLEDKWGTVGW